MASERGKAQTIYNYSWQAFYIWGSGALQVYLLIHERVEKWKMSGTVWNVRPKMVIAQ